MNPAALIYCIRSLSEMVDQNETKLKDVISLALWCPSKIQIDTAKLLIGHSKKCRWYSNRLSRSLSLSLCAELDFAAS